jgi:hypothetical protein
MGTAPWTQPTAHSRPARDDLTVGNLSEPLAANPQRPEQHARLGRAYRAGRLVCGCVHVTVVRDGGLGLAPHERRLVRVRFHEPVDEDLRAELTQLVRRRGAAARRVVERVDPIEVVVDDPYGERQRIVGHLEPPQVRHGQLRGIEFELRRTR